MLNHVIRGFISLLLYGMITLFTGCAFFLPGEAEHRRSGDDSGRSVDWYESSEVHQDLLSLPAAKGRMTVSVYNFRDQTGQYLPQPANAFSTAVPQGTLPMLVSTLRKTGWFELVEREGLQNLLTERKILRARKDERGDKNPIKALSAANVIIEGGILAYDTNIRTGGGGAKYVGIGSGGQYREDQVTIGLRIVDVNSGRIFNSVSVTKKLLSTQISSNVFRFIRYKKLLEVEGGYTETDPAQVVVMDAIEAAVVKLIISGIIQNHWALKFDVDENHPLMEKYSDPIQYATWKQKRFERRFSERNNKNSKNNISNKGNISHIKNKNSKNSKKIGEGEEGRSVNGKNGSGSGSGSGKSGKGDRGAVMLPKVPPKKAAQGAQKRKGGSAKVISARVVEEGPMSILESAALNVKMKKGVEADLAKEVTQSITKNRARAHTLMPQRNIGNYYTIQLYAGKTDRALNRFLDEYPSLSGDVWQVREQFMGQYWYMVVYGKYQNKARAQHALEALPLHVKDLSPWIRLYSQKGASN